ncbi:ribosomal protein S18 acetylase RimI-like enzyme [Breoghania corrubedonensis]|uniref:Ribosomal protein S18 acetylase RimI-like enzyme n=1 Tax=Breoghania corrubedonensis TaxID=665038 RepID=A0A2T5V7D4_9HYPH|nr:GNAT family N-acetyltransferase [Breoghania corrubedonensis]PTW59657.1 ribosomal protein S18 acetylase RimI-like enzyme [Breoghania corrubedonensis]
MIPLLPPLRIAMASDAARLADLVNFAGDGLPLHLWAEMAQDGQDPWEVGRARQAEKAQDGQIVVLDEGAGAIAMLLGYAIGSEPVPTDDMRALFVPLQELENLAPDSWYVNVLAACPRHRGKGHGTRLLETAREIARAKDLSRMSIIVADDNDGARRLYERAGYRECAARDAVHEGWKTATKRWILMIRELDRIGRA